MEYVTCSDLVDGTKLSSEDDVYKLFKQDREEKSQYRLKIGK